MNQDLPSLLAEIERLRTALQAIRDTPRAAGILTCQRIASDALAGAVVSASTETSLGDPSYWREAIQYLHYRWKGRCAYCGNDGASQIDHVMPVSRGGSDEVKNLVLACEACNTNKGARTAGEFGFSDMAIVAIAQSMHGWRKAAERNRKNAALIQSIFPPDKDQPF